VDDDPLARTAAACAALARLLLNNTCLNSPQAALDENCEGAVRVDPGAQQDEEALLEVQAQRAV